MLKLAAAFAFIALPVMAAPPDAPMPNPALTPGATLSVSLAAICAPGYARHARHVTRAARDEVFAAYGLASADRRDYELDHLIPLEVGGSNALANLWPEPRAGAWGARRKDRLENALHRDVCDGSVPLAVAQRAVASDWIAAYQRFVTQNPAGPADR